MTQAEIDTMKKADGMYLVGNSQCPSYGILVASMNGQLSTMQASTRLSEDAATWHITHHLLAGPITASRMRDLNAKAAEVEGYVTMLTHDLDIWKSLCLQMKLLLKTGTWQTKGTQALAAKLVKTADGYLPPPKTPPKPTS